MPEPHLLITAGPTREPIDAVRYIGNRSSGRLGVSLADEAASRGWAATLLLGPTALLPVDPRVKVRRFQTTAELQSLISQHVPACDVLVMAAAVADYRPCLVMDGKLRREGGSLTLELEPTPDLLAAAAARRRPDQLFVGFALEPRATLPASAAAKLARKKLDLIVANPLETMDSPDIEATVLDAAGVVYQSDSPVSKARFARVLLDLMATRMSAKPINAAARS